MSFGYAEKRIEHMKGRATFCGLRPRASNASVVLGQQLLMECIGCLYKNEFQGLFVTASQSNSDRTVSNRRCVKLPINYFLFVNQMGV